MVSCVARTPNNTFFKRSFVNCIFSNSGCKIELLLPFEIARKRMATFLLNIKPLLYERESISR